MRSARRAAAPSESTAGADPLRPATLSGSEDVDPGAAVHEELGALRGPFGRTPVRVRRGESVRVEVVVRTRDVGHVFPGGTMDAFDVWLELKATDEKGRVILWSGEASDGGRGPVDPAAHRYHVALIDAHGNPINKRNAWAARALVYARSIPPGAADTAHFRLAVPPDAGDRITVEAKVNHRKFSWWNTQFAYAGRRDPTQGPLLHRQGPRRRPLRVRRRHRPACRARPSRFPISRSRSWPATRRPSRSLPAGAPIDDGALAEHEKDRGRWNDYGIGLLLQGHLKAAEAAFLTVTRIDPKYADGWVNVARCRLEEGNVAGAREVLDKALALAPGAGQGPLLHGHGGQARRPATTRRSPTWGARPPQFPGDRVIHNETGRILFLQRRYADAVAAFARTLAIDPEDLTAHYNLILCHRGLGDDEGRGDVGDAVPPVQGRRAVAGAGRAVPAGERPRQQRAPADPRARRGRAPQPRPRPSARDGRRLKRATVAAWRVGAGGGARRWPAAAVTPPSAT